MKKIANVWQAQGWNEPSACRGLGAKTLMKKSIFVNMIVMTAGIFLGSWPAWSEGDAAKGARAIKPCLACHALQEGRQMTGPSLNAVMGRKAGSLAGFERYSPAIKGSGIVWTEDTLNAWLANPQALIPGNRMAFILEDAAARADIIAYLNATQGPAETRKEGLPIPFQTQLDLKATGAATRVASIKLCRDTYDVTMENGVTQQFWERNLRLKTDSSIQGPPAGKPVLIQGGMEGDRAYVVFATPTEISSTIKSECATGSGK